MHYLLPVLVTMLIAAAAFTIFLSMRRPSEVVLRERLNAIAPDRLNKPISRPLEELELSRPFEDRVLKPILVWLSGITKALSPGTSIEKTDRNLAQAGTGRRLTVEFFYGLKVVAAVGLTAFTVGFMYLDPLPGTVPYPPQAPATAVIWGVSALVLGFFLPDLWIRQKIQKRQKAISKALPDVIDIIAISVEAGLGFDGACQRVAAKRKDEIGLEFERFLIELRLGKPRREALRNVVWRTGVKDLQLFVNAIIQADILGVSIANVLRIQSDQIRMRRRQRAEELAQKAPIKMLFPMAFFIFPAIFVVILGPIVPQIQGGLG
jgi:tight adherence protein C